jgi:prevent-host-death family protein
MQQFNIAEAKSHFSEMVRMAMMGEDVVIAKDNKPLLKLVPVAAVRKARQPGTARGQILSMAPDFDELPANFEEYV